MGLTGLTADSQTSSIGSQKNQQFVIEANHLKEGVQGKGSAATQARQARNASPIMQAQAAAQLGSNNDKNQKKGKNVLGFDFEIPDELSQILAEEMRKQQADGKGND